MNRAVLAAAFAGLLALPALAAPVPVTTSYSGSFAADDDVALIDVLIEDLAAFVTVRTVSYAGGTLADGTEVPAGGFDPVLSMFDASGALVASDSDGVDVPVDPATGADFDALIDTPTPLPVGAYTLAVTQYDNFPVDGTLAGGFDEAGDPNFTAIFECEDEQFCDFTGDSRSADYALDVTLAPIPLPAAAWLLGGALMGLGLLRRRA